MFFLSVVEVKGSLGKTPLHTCWNMCVRQDSSPTWNGHFQHASVSNVSIYIGNQHSPSWTRPRLPLVCLQKGCKSPKLLRWCGRSRLERAAALPLSQTWTDRHAVNNINCFNSLTFNKADLPNTHTQHGYTDITNHIIKDYDFSLRQVSCLWPAMRKNAIKMA